MQGKSETFKKNWAFFKGLEARVIYGQSEGLRHNRT